MDISSSIAPARPTVPGQKRSLRFHALDSVRGIAALVVVFHHCLLSIPGWEEKRTALFHEGFGNITSYLYLTPLRIFVCGPAAVLVFFVLSGFVLAVTFIERDRDRYLPYIIKRITRIWPTFAVVIMLSALLSLPFYGAHIAGTSPWFAYTWSDFPSARIVLAHLAMTGSQIGLDNPMWSLIHEIRISLIFPLLVFLTVARWKTTLAASILLTIVTTKIIGLNDNSHLIKTLGMTVEFVFLFVAGIVIAARVHDLRARMARLPAGAIALMWIISLAVLSFPPVSTDVVNKISDGVLLLTSGAAAAMVVILSTVEGKVVQMLLGPIPRYLGRISYSLYLIHVVVIAFVVHVFSGYAPVPVLVVAAAALSFPLADLMQRYVEVPTTNLGRKWARSLMPA